MGPMDVLLVFILVCGDVLLVFILVCGVHQGTTYLPGQEYAYRTHESIKKQRKVQRILMQRYKE